MFFASSDNEKLNRVITRVLIAASLMNIGGVLIFSKVFTNIAINNADPVVMSNFGLIMIVIWGLAYLGATTVMPNIKWLLSVFALEKLVYVIVWLKWLSKNDLTSLYSIDVFAGVFYSIYGINDFVFMVLFFWLFYTLLRENQV